MNNNITIKIIGEAIRVARKQKDLTQEYMALKLGYRDKSTYAKIERGELGAIDIILLSKICKLLEMDLITLLKHSGLTEQEPIFT